MNDDDIATARKYAEAYAAFDTEASRAVLAPKLQFRQVNPGGYLTVSSAEDYIEATAEFLSNFTAHAPLAARSEPVGDRVATASRMDPTSGAHAYVMEHQEFVTVAGGRVVAIDSACTGARPA